MIDGFEQRTRERDAIAEFCEEYVRYAAKTSVGISETDATLIRQAAGDDAENAAPHIVSW